MFTKLPWESNQVFLSQRRDSKNKLHNLHILEINCISKDKSHRKYELGCKVGLVSTAKNAFIVEALAFI